MTKKKHWAEWLDEAIWYVIEEVDHGRARSEKTAKLHGLKEFIAAYGPVSILTAKHANALHKKTNHEAAIRKRVGERYLPVRRVPSRPTPTTGVTVRSTSSRNGAP